jgi:hypothetical protein
MGLSNTWRLTIVPCAAAIAIAVLTGGAAAQNSAQQNAVRQNCRDDFMSHCSGVQPGGKDALACLQQNVAGLSSGCKKAVSATMRAPSPAAAKRAAPAPVATAPAAPPAEGGMVPGAILIDKACARYMLMHCQGFAFDPGRKVACLVDYVKAGNFVGPRCKAVLEMTGHLR